MKNDGGWSLPEVLNPPNTRPACICVPDDLNQIKAFWGALYELGYQFNWARDEGHNALPTSIKWMAIVREAHEKWLEGVMCTSCDELNACLAPLYDIVTALQASINAQTALIEAQTDMLETIIDNTKMYAPSPPSAVCTEANIYPGAAAVVSAMHEENIRLYNQAELSNADNAAEVAAVIVSAIPGFGILPFDEMAALANWYFGNQVDNYEAAYTSDFQAAAAYSLMCHILANDCIFDFEVWGAWLLGLQAYCDVYITDGSADVAIGLYAKYAPASQTFLNTIGQAIAPDDGNAPVSLKEYFNDLYRAYAIEAESSAPPPSGYECLNIFEVLATTELPGNDTGFDVVNGTAYDVEASGLWNGGVGTYTADGQIGVYEPTATLPTTAYVYQLIWRVGTSGAWLPGGAAFTIPDTTPSGRLYMMINDCDGCRGDNSGALTVSVVTA